jgi:deoxyribodipyrimidine photo-lyase
MIYWIRRDLRLDDNPALLRAASGEAMLPVYIHNDTEEGPWPLGGAQRWWLARSLPRFAETLARLGSRLVIVRGEAAPVLSDLAKRLDAREVVWSRRFDPSGLAQERRVEAALDRLGVAWSAFHSNHLYDPEEVATKEGRPYQVYTPFSRNVRARSAPARPKSAPAVLPGADGAPTGIDPERAGSELELDPAIDWAAGMRAMWTPGEAGAATRLAAFAKGPLGAYPEGRDNPSIEGSSLLSPHLAFGEVGIRRIWHAAQHAAQPAASIDKFHAELLWREFGTHVLYHFPRTDLAPLRAEYSKFPWRSDARALRAWQRGQTGYPLVDAGMRQLWSTGWMHNRVRMVVASFLVKHLLLAWQDGARWFWDTLLDADLGNNSLGWQWSAGSGADAAPYFRIFNPTSQAEKFDPAAAYVKRWVPELARVPAKYALAPWDAPPLVLAQAGVTLGDEYPRPIVDHAEARTRALAALASVSKGKSAAAGVSEGAGE